MPQSVSVTCPSCGASLKITKPSLIGRKLPCPSCRNPFVIAVPAQANTDSQKSTAENGSETAKRERNGTEKPPRERSAERGPARRQTATVPSRKTARTREKSDSDDFANVIGGADDVVLDAERPQKAAALAPLGRRPKTKPAGRPKSSKKAPIIVAGIVAAFLGLSWLASLMTGSKRDAPNSSPVAMDTASTPVAPPTATSLSKGEATIAHDKQSLKLSKQAIAATKPPAKTIVIAPQDAPAPPPLQTKPLANNVLTAMISSPSASGAITSPLATPAGKDPLVGRVIPAFSATAIDNTTFRSADHKEQVLVVAFLGVECPLANLYCPRLAELAKKYHGKSVGLIAVNSNAQDTLEEVQKQARANGMTFSILKDAGNVVANQFGAERTPEAFVLDAQRVVRYHGLIDDQYGYRQRRETPSKNYVADVVDALLSGGSVAVAETVVQGCHIGRITQPSKSAKTSFYRDVLPVLQNRCQQCHRKGEIGPFALSDYEEVRDWGPTIREAVTERRMPPWPADSHFGDFANNISLAPEEIQTITKWVDEGCPAGNAAEKPPEKKFVQGWNIGKPDKVYPMSQTFHVPATGVIEYKNFYASPVFAQDTWVQAVECRFGNRAVVHHMLVLLDFPNDKSRSQDGLVKGFFAAGAPGSTYFIFPKGYAKRIPKGARLRFQMHYTPNGSPADDQSSFGIVLAKGGSHREVQTFALGKPDFVIPAGAADHVETATQPVPSDVILTTLMPHLHVRGKSFTFTAVSPDGKKTLLLSVPKWDFNWQYQYQLAKPITLPKGSKLIVEAHWDNSVNNPNNVLPPVDVGFGEQTFDEMFIGYINFVPKYPVADATRSRGKRKRG